MIRTRIYKKINYYLLLSVSEIFKLIIHFLQKDAEVFLQNYSFLTMEPKEAWHHLGISLCQAFRYIKAKVPAFIPIAIKLAFSFSLIIIIGLMTLGSLLAINQSHLLDAQARQFGNTLAKQTANAIKEPLLAADYLSVQLITTKLFNSDSIIGVNVYDSQHKIIISHGVEEKLPRIQAEKIDDLLKIFDILSVVSIENDFVSYSHTIQHNTLRVGSIGLSIDNSALTQVKKKTTETILFITLITVLIGICAAFFMSKLITKPINQLLEITRQIKEGKLQFSRADNQRNDEIGILMRSLNEMNQGLLEKKKVENIFSRYVSPQVASQVLKDLSSLNEIQLGGKHVKASIVFADIVGFTSLSETLEPSEISHLLNVYFSKIAQVVNFCHGHVDKYIGDCAMIVFGVPVEQEDHAFNSIACSWMILQLIKRFNQQRKAQEKLTVDFRIGINAGMVLAGNMGSEDRMEYTVVGDSVNLASRLLGVAEPMEMIITEVMLADYNLIDKIDVETKEMMKLRGIKEPIKTLKVTDILTLFKIKMIQKMDDILNDD